MHECMALAPRFNAYKHLIVFISADKCHSSLKFPTPSTYSSRPPLCALINVGNCVCWNTLCKTSWDCLATSKHAIGQISISDWTEKYLSSVFSMLVYKVQFTRVKLTLSTFLPCTISASSIFNTKINGLFPIFVHYSRMQQFSLMQAILQLRRAYNVEVPCHRWFSRKIIHLQWWNPTASPYSSAQLQYQQTKSSLMSRQLVLSLISSSSLWHRSLELAPPCPRFYRCSNSHQQDPSTSNSIL